jgi:hypothetical protein
VIAALRFGSPKKASGRTIRAPIFEKRSTLPLQAACLIANGACEQLKKLLACDLVCDLIGPLIPDASAREVLLTDAIIYRVRGRLCDVFLSLRQDDARRLSAIAFGESERPVGDPLSQVESATLERIFTTIVPLCVPLCGTLGAVSVTSPSHAAMECVAYFELRFSGIGVAIGFSLTKDPAEEVKKKIRLDDLLDVEVQGRVSCAQGRATFAALNDLRVDAVLPLETRWGEEGGLRFGSVLFARGTCGVRAGRTAFLAGAV